MNSNEHTFSPHRRGFLKKSLYSAPALVVLGHLTPAMVYGASGGLVETPQAAAAVTPVAAKASAPVPGAGVPGGSVGNGSGPGGTPGGQQGGSNGAGQNQNTDGNADATVKEDEKKKKKV